MHYVHAVNVESGRSDSIVVKKDQVLTFLDNKYLAYCSSLERILYYPEKLPEPVMTATKPWEKNGKYQCVGGFSGKCFVVTPDKLMMFYSVYHMGGWGEWRSFAYAESRDGYHWTKPDINKGTNLLIDNRDVWNIKSTKNEPQKRPYYELQNVVYDEHSGQYLGLGHCKISRQKYGTFVASTKDPLHWNPKDFKILYKNDDIHALMGWDEDRKGYVSYIRVPVYQYGIEKRAIGISVSKDFKTWTTPILCLQPWLNSSHQIYNMPVTKYGGYYLGFPIHYSPNKNHAGSLQSGLVVSHDGVTWASQSTEYIPRGLPGEWDDCYADTAAPFVWKDTMWFYYWGCNFPHDDGFKEEKENKGSVGLAVLPKNRMYSLACNRHMPGSLSIVPLYLPENGMKIVLNAHLPHGNIEAYDGVTKLAVIPKNGMEFYLCKSGKKEWGDYHFPVNLKLYLSDAEVFSISFE